MTESKSCECGYNNIKSSNILIGKDMKFLTENIEELKRCEVVNQNHRTKFEMEFSVLNDSRFPIKQSKYYQAIREELVMFRGIVVTCDQANVEQKKIDLLNAEINELTTSKIDKAIIELKKAEILQLEYYIAQKKDEIHGRMREIRQWEDLKSKLTKGEKFNINDVDTFQEEHWTKRWTLDSSSSSKHNLATFRKNKK